MIEDFFVDQDNNQI